MSQSNISIILVDTQLPENVGLSSRAMFNFGIEDLKIVSPKLEWPSEKAHAVAVDSHSIVDNAKVYKDLKEALSDIDYSVAFTARRRDMNKEIVSNEKLIDEIILKPKKSENRYCFWWRSIWINKRTYFSCIEMRNNKYR